MVSLRKFGQIQQHEVKKRTKDKEQANQNERCFASLFIFAFISRILALAVLLPITQQLSKDDKMGRGWEIC